MLEKIAPQHNSPCFADPAHPCLSMRLVQAAFLAGKALLVFSEAMEPAISSAFS
jgi:hypothetical protein